MALKRLATFIVGLNIIGWSLVRSGQLLVPGNVTVIGMFKIYESTADRCDTAVDMESVMISEAIKWYFRKVNEDGGLPFKIGLEGRATCRLNAEVSNIAVDIMHRTMKRRNDSTATDDIVIGVIGPEYSEEAEVLSSLLSSAASEQRLVQVGFSTTAASLHNIEKFPNFIRVVPNDTTEVNAMVSTMLELGWNRIAIIYENDLYGRDGAFSLKVRAEEVGICVSFLGSINVQPSVSEISNIRDRILYGDGDQPPTSGIIVWGSGSAADLLLRSFELTFLSDAPVAILSEGSSLQNGNLLQKARGSYTVRPPYREINEFNQHWISIFTNESVFNEETKSNPWLLAVRESKACEGGDSLGCPFSPLPLTDLGLQYEPLFVQYAITAAHQMAHALQSLYIKTCGNTDMPCVNFYRDLSVGAMIEELKDSVIDLQNTFPFSLSAFENITRSKITRDGEIEFHDNAVSYELYNFRDTEENANIPTFQLIKVGEFRNRTMAIDKAAVRDYDTVSGAIKYWPDTRKGACGVGDLCSECIPSDIADQVLTTPGDAYVVALVPVHDAAKPSECGSIRSYNGYQLAEAIKFAVETFNNDSENANFMKAGLIVLNSCNSPSVVQRRVAMIRDKEILLLDGSVLDLNGKIFGFVGDVGSGISIAASEVLTNLQYVQVSYGSTSPALSDRQRYPYFMRVVTPAFEQVRAIVGIIKNFGANYVQIIYSKGAYGEDANKVFLEMAQSEGICVVQEIVVEENTFYYQYFEEMRKYPHAKLVVVFLRSHVVQPFFKDITSFEQMTKGSFSFIGSTAWAQNKYVLQNDKRQITLGSIVVEQDSVENDKLDMYMRHLKPTNVRENPWIQAYFEHKLDCYFPTSFDKQRSKQCNSSDSFDQSEWVTTAYSATVALLRGAKARVVEACGFNVNSLCPDFNQHPLDLVEEIKKVDEQVLFDSNADGKLGFTVYQIARVPNDSSKLLYKKVGTVSPGQKISAIEVEIDAEITSECPNDLACAGCLDIGSVKPDNDKDGELNIGMLTFGLLFAIAFCIIVILIILIVYLRKSVPENPYEESGYIHATYDGGDSSTGGGYVHTDDLHNSNGGFELGACVN